MCANSREWHSSTEESVANLREVPLARSLLNGFVMNPIRPLAAALFVGASVAASVACTSATIPDGFTSACEAGATTTLRFAAGLRPEREVDFVGVRVESTVPRGGGSPLPSPGMPCPPDAGGCDPTPRPPQELAEWSADFTGDQRGVLCGGASDRAACEKLVRELRRMANVCDGLSVVAKAAAPPSEKPRGTCSLTYLVYTRGDEVGTITSAPEARAFFGVIDSPQEAMYLASLEGERFTCDAATPAAYAEIADGYEVATSPGEPSSTCERRILQVSKAGVVRFVRKEGC